MADDRLERADAFLRDLTELTRRHRIVLGSWCDEPALFDADTHARAAQHGLRRMEYRGSRDDSWRSGPVISEVDFRLGAEGSDG